MHFPAQEFDFPCFILTIETEETGKRRLHATHELEALGLNGIFVQGYNKADPSLSEHYDPRMNRLASKRGLTAGEIAVYCGHRKIWREFLASGHPHALVFEDDFCALEKSKLSAAIKDGAKHHTHWNILKFFDFKPKRVRERKVLNETAIVRHKYTASGMVAYMIDRHAAKKLLSRKQFFRAVDEDISWPWELDLAVWSVSPNVVTEISHSLGGSLLEKDRVAHKAERNLLRSLWGNVISAYKLARALIYRQGIPTKDAT